MSDILLANLWFAAVCLEVALYVLLDGADLGMGVLSLLPHKETDRSLIMHTVGPIWDANETWLVIAGGTLFGAFPLAYGIILNALYVPVMLLLFGLILRAVSFEFHAFSDNKKLWSFVFGLGSLIAVLAQGAAIGGILGGIPIVNGQFAGSIFSWFTPLTFFITLGVLMSYVVVGYAYLIRKTDHELHGESFRRVFISAGVTFVTLLAATLVLPHSSYLFFTRWTTEPTRTILYGIAALIGFLSLFLIADVLKQHRGPRIHTLCLFIFGAAFAGMLVGVFPYIIPSNLTIYEAAASHKTLTFMLYGLGPLIPIVLAYNFYLYRVFRKDLPGSRAETYG